MGKNAMRNCYTWLHKTPNQFWKVFKTPQKDSCPVELTAQLEAFQALMGAQPGSTAVTPAVFASCPSDCIMDCLNADITAVELCKALRQLKRGKSPGMGGVLAGMIKDGGDLSETCLLWLFRCMLASHNSVSKPCLLGTLFRPQVGIAAVMLL